MKVEFSINIPSIEWKKVYAMARVGLWISTLLFYGTMCFLSGYGFKGHTFNLILIIGTILITAGVCLAMQIK